jgi:2'-hydroxyisoflavone reductase
VRPGGPSGRFTYWPERMARGDEVLAPGAPSDPLQIMDVRDLAAWLVTLIEQGATGIYNAVGPKDGLAWGDLLEGCRKATGGPASWYRGQPEVRQTKLAGSAEAKEAELLAKWKVARAESRSAPAAAPCQFLN